MNTQDSIAAGGVPGSQFECGPDLDPPKSRFFEVLNNMFEFAEEPDQRGHEGFLYRCWEYIFTKFCETLLRPDLSLTCASQWPILHRHPDLGNRVLQFCLPDFALIISTLRGHMPNYLLLIVEVKPLPKLDWDTEEGRKKAVDILVQTITGQVRRQARLAFLRQPNHEEITALLVCAVWWSATTFQRAQLVDSSHHDYVAPPSIDKQRKRGFDASPPTSSKKHNLRRKKQRVVVESLSPPVLSASRNNTEAASSEPEIETPSPPNRTNLLDQDYVPEPEMDHPDEDPLESGSPLIASTDEIWLKTVDHVFQLPHKKALNPWLRAFFKDLVDDCPVTQAHDFRRTSIFDLDPQEQELYQWKLRDQRDYNGHEDGYVLPYQGSKAMEATTPEIDNMVRYDPPDANGFDLYQILIPGLRSPKIDAVSTLEQLLALVVSSGVIPQQWNNPQTPTNISRLLHQEWERPIRPLPTQRRGMNMNAVAGDFADGQGAFESVLDGFDALPEPESPSAEAHARWTARRASEPGLTFPSNEFPSNEDDIDPDEDDANVHTHTQPVGRNKGKGQTVARLHHQPKTSTAQPLASTESHSRWDPVGFRKIALHPKIVSVTIDQAAPLHQSVVGRTQPAAGDSGSSAATQSRSQSVASGPTPQPWKQSANIYAMGSSWKDALSRNQASDGNNFTHSRSDQTVPRASAQPPNRSTASGNVNVMSSGVAPSVAGLNNAQVSRSQVNASTDGPSDVATGTSSLTIESSDVPQTGTDRVRRPSIPAARFYGTGEYAPKPAKPYRLPHSE